MADTAHRSTPELLTLHAVRLKGLADDAEVASRFDLDRSESDELLLDYEAYGWVTRSDFAGTTGWSMTAAGRQEDERLLADELQATGALKTVHDAYREFLPVNARSPTQAADVVRGIFEILANGVRSIATFFDSLLTRG